MSEDVISLENIYKTFGGVNVLEDVGFNLKKGSIHALVGGNGAGKSTLMKILTGVYSCEKGTIKVNGVPVEINNYNEAVNNGISLIFQELSLIPTLSVTENVFLSREIKKFKMIDKKEMTVRTKKLLEELDLTINTNEKIQNLEVGTCQMIEIAKALSVNASIIIMDEPTASLTEKETEKLFSIIKRLKDKGVSVIYISHRMNEIFRIADEISVLRDGRNVANKKVAEYNMETLISDIIGNKEKKSLIHKERSANISDELMLRIENLEIKNKLHNISFSLRRGEIIGFAGLMASGRTEVLESIFGIRNFDGGRIFIEGREVRFQSVQDAIDNGIVLIPEDRRRQGLILEHSLKENIILPNLKRVKRGIMIKKALVNDVSKSGISDLNIKTDNINTPLFNLSGGNQQKVVISKWLKTEPKILLMDEPTAGIDIGAKSEIIEMIRNFADNGQSVIFVSSELTEMMAVCDRILLFNKGKITGELKCIEIANEEVLQHAIQDE